MNMMKYCWLIVVVLLQVLVAFGLYGPRVAVAEDVAVENKPTENIPDVTEQDSVYSAAPSDATEESVDHLANTVEDDSVGEGQPRPEAHPKVSETCSSNSDNLNSEDCGEKSIGDSVPGEDATIDAEKEEGDEDKSRTKLFSLRSVIKIFFDPVMQEFKEAMSDKETTNFTEASNITIVGDNTTSIDDDAQGDKNATDSRKKFKFNCTGRNITENTTAAVQIVNSTVLLDVLSFTKNKTASDCVLVMFFAPWCQFCAKTAPHFNALARAFPQLEVLAVDAVHFSNLNARFGTVAVPNLMLFHQSRSAIRFNHTERNFDMFIQFVKNVTGLEPDPLVNVTEADWEGPLSSVPTEETDYLLLLAWLFVVTCSGWMFVHSHLGQCAINKVRQLWQEHQHIE